jgi:hypothetical protein
MNAPAPARPKEKTMNYYKAATMFSAVSILLASVLICSKVDARTDRNKGQSDMFRVALFKRDGDKLNRLEQIGAVALCELPTAGDIIEFGDDRRDAYVDHVLIRDGERGQVRAIVHSVTSLP